jgi:hypothetical protein
MKLEFSQQIFENPQILDFMKIRPVGAMFFHVDRQTVRQDKANNRFSQFSEKHLKKEK